MVEEGALVKDLAFERINIEKEQAKVEGDFGQMIACMPEPATEVRKV